MTLHLSNSHRTWGHERFTLAQVAEACGEPAELVEDVIRSFDTAVETILGLDGVVIATLPIDDSTMSWIVLGNDDNDPRVMAVHAFDNERNRCIDAGHPEKRPRFGELPEILEAADIEELGFDFSVHIADDLAAELGEVPERVRSIVDAFWSLVYSQPELEDLSFMSGRFHKTERDIEAELASDLTLFEAVGLDLKLWSDHTGRTGQQYVLADRTRPDLICVDDEGNVVIVELKAFPCRDTDVAQLAGYLEAFEGQFNIIPKGVMVTNGTTTAGRAALGKHAAIQQVQLVEVL